VESVKYYHRDNGAVVAPVANGQPAGNSGGLGVHASLPDAPVSYLGVYENSSLTSYAPVDRFASAVGRQPNIVLYFSGWGEGFNTTYADTARAHGASLMVDLDPTNTSVASIANGRQDAYLGSLAETVRSYAHPVIISFGHEMNGAWYTWGWTHTSPRTWVRAWRHIVQVFRSAGADNVTWVWTVNSVGPGEGSIRAWWPGAAYVTWTAFDAYYYGHNSTFSNVFETTIEAIRQITNKPILIAETAIGQVSGQVAKIPGLFAGIRKHGLLGFIWFDPAQHDGVFHQDWRLEGHPAAEAAFKQGIRRYFG
jgi:hypothetical protein